MILSLSLSFTFCTAEKTSLLGAAWWCLAVVSSKLHLPSFLFPCNPYLSMPCLSLSLSLSPSRSLCLSVCVYVQDWNKTKPSIHPDHCGAVEMAMRFYTEVPNRYSNMLFKKPTTLQNVPLHLWASRRWLSVFHPRSISKTLQSNVSIPLGQQLISSLSCCFCICTKHNGPQKVMPIHRAWPALLKSYILVVGGSFVQMCNMLTSIC